MRCPSCGAEIEGERLLCPACGAALPQGGSAPRPSRRWLHPLLWVLAALALLALTVAISGYAGLYYGERDREAERQATIQEHYQAGLEALNAGQYEIARAHFQYILQLDPDNAMAEQGAAEVEARIAARPTPTSEVVRPLADQLWEKAKAAYEAQDWEEAASLLTQLRSLDPEYQADEVEEMLFHSLYEAGMALLDEDQLEEGIFYLDRAVALRPLDEEAAYQRNLAARYLAALNLWGVDWEGTIEALKELYALAPDYKDVYQRLYRAYVEYGDSLSEQGEMCPAEMAYTEALRLFADPQVESKREQAAQVCLVATPAAANGAQPMLTPQRIPGFNVGRLAYPVYNEESGLYDLFALYDNGRILRVAKSADQPWWEWGTGRVIYRDRLNNAFSMVLPEEGVPLLLMAADGKAWPTLSPDGQRLAYAAPDATGVWSIYVTRTDGSAEPRRLAAGWSPAWGPTGLIAYTGCEADGESCGIFVLNPDDGSAPRRLTGSMDDTAVAWAPSGNLMAYMTDVAGNWDVMLLSLEGGVVPFTTEPSEDGLPAWAPDGSGLAFVSNRDGKWAIYVADPNGQNVQRIVDLGEQMPAWDNQRLSWSP